jgi:hypothetical protein
MHTARGTRQRAADIVSEAVADQKKCRHDRNRGF